MGVVDDVRDSLTEGSDPDTYAVSDTRREDDTAIGTVSPERLRELIREHPDACRAFEIRSGAGYEDPSTLDSGLSQAEHAGRVEIDPEEILGGLSSELCSVQVRLDTSAPQLVTVIESSGAKEVEIDDTIARFTPPASDHRSE